MPPPPPPPPLPPSPSATTIPLLGVRKKEAAENNKNNNNNKGSVLCSSSSSADETEQQHLDGGWPSAVSLLETPDRHRVRCSLRSGGNINSSSNGRRKHSRRRRSLTVAAGALMSAASSLLPSSASSSSQQIGAASVACENSSGSPPIIRRLASSIPAFSSPTLRTPRQQQQHSSSSSVIASIHFSKSPLRSFFLKEGGVGGGPGSPVAGCSPYSSSSFSSSFCASFSSDAAAPYANAGHALRPLGLHNYIGVRFSGDQQQPLLLEQSDEQKRCFLKKHSSPHTPSKNDEENEEGNNRENNNATKIIDRFFSASSSSSNDEKQQLEQQQPKKCHQKQKAAASNSSVAAVAVQQQRRRFSKDSGYSETPASGCGSGAASCSNSTTRSDQDRSSLVAETPSKGLLTASAAPSCSSSYFSQQHPFLHSSTPLFCGNHFVGPTAAAAAELLDLSPVQRPLEAAPPLLLFDSTNSLSSSIDSSSSFFHSPVPEQSYGPLEASIVSGILDDFAKMQRDALSMEEVEDADDVYKASTSQVMSSKIEASSRSLSFERRLFALKRRRRESPRKINRPQTATTTSILEWPRIERHGIPSNLLIDDGVDDNNLAVGGQRNLEAFRSGKGGGGELALLFPSLDSRDYQLMFGETPDQLEIRGRARRLLGSLQKRFTKSAGPLPHLQKESRKQIL